MALTFTKVISSSPRALVVLGSDGQTYSVTGDRSQRNNNPGAIAYSPVAIAHGAVGYDTINGTTKLAVFPDMASGQAAQQELLFGSDTNHPAYRNMTLQQAISKYAPGGVDGNPPPQSYYTRIANGIGVSADTLLSDLTPAQQAAFMQVQAGIEGSKPQKIADAQGNVVQTPPADIPGAAGGSDWASAFANVSQPKSSALSAIGAATAPPPLPRERPSMGPAPAAPASIDNLYNQHWQPVPLAPLPSTFASRPDVIPPNGPAPGSAPPVPLPASARPPAPAPLNSKGYEIGKVYTMANGATFEAQPDGSFTKVASTPRAPTAIQTLIEASKPGVMSTVGTLVNDAKNAGPATVDAAKGAAASIGSAASGLGSLVGGLFNHSAPPPLPASTAYHAPPPSPTPSSAYHSTSNAGDSLAFNPVPHGPSINDGLTVPSFDAWMQNGQMRPLLTPNANANFDPPPNNYGTPGYSGNSGYGPASYAPAVPKTITQSYLNPAYVTPPPASPFTNPGVQGLSPDDRQALNDANRAAAMKAAAQAAVPQYLTRTIPNPAYKAPPLAYPTGGNVFANALNHTHLGGLLSLLGGGQNASDMLFGGNSTGIPPLPGGLSHIASSLATAQPGQTAYSAPGGGLVPLVTINGQPRTGSYGDSTMGVGGSLASRG